jgi:hypothetical protein
VLSSVCFSSGVRDSVRVSPSSSSARSVVMGYIIAGSDALTNPHRHFLLEEGEA